MVPKNLPHCYYSARGEVWVTPTYVVPFKLPSELQPVVNCCGRQDTFLSNGLCVNSFTYYLSPCTDPAYNSSVCPRYCENRSDKNQLDVRYDPSDGLWHCCVPGGPGTCSGFTDETFEAPRPSQLKVQYPYKSDKLPSWVPTGIPVSEQNMESGNSLSAGAILGIVFGILGAILTMVGLYIAWKTYLLKRQKHLDDELQQKNVVRSGNSSKSDRA